MITEETDLVGWYCVRSKPKHEHIAAANLRRHCGFEVFSPRIRLRRARPNGPFWVCEPLFPGYLFARLSLQTGLDRLQHAAGVKAVVRFGVEFPMVPNDVIEDIRNRMGEEETCEHETPFLPGDQVDIAEGPLRGLTAVVQFYLPANQRVKVLIDFLGRLASAEIGAEQLVGARRYPELLLADFVSDR